MSTTTVWLVFRQHVIMAKHTVSKVQYRSGRAVFGEAAFFLVRSSMLCALATVFVVHHAAVLPALLAAVKQSPAVDALLRTHPAMRWLQAAFFDGRSAADVSGQSLFDALLFVAIFVATHEAVFWGVGGFFLLCDAAGWLQQYKLPRAPRMLVTRSLLAQTVGSVAANHFLFQPAAVFLLYRYAAAFPSMYAADGAAAPAPPLALCFAFFLACQVVNEVLFYAAHRLMHEVPWLYRTAHKQHHRHVGTIGFASEFAHPVEQLLGNHIPTLCVAFGASAHVPQSAVFVWLAFRIWESSEAHVGYDLRGSAAERLGLTFSRHNEFHDWHHTDNRGNYGWEWLDWLGGTMDSFAAMKRNANDDEAWTS
jgi:methylsterol monooxygenase